MPNDDTYDVFSGVPNGRDVLWICSIQGLSDAKEKMEQFARTIPGAYFVLFTPKQQVMASTDTIANRKSA